MLQFFYCLCCFCSRHLLRHLIFRAGGNHFYHKEHLGLLDPLIIVLCYARNHSIRADDEAVQPALMYWARNPSVQKVGPAPAVLGGPAVLCYCRHNPLLPPSAVLPSSFFSSRLYCRGIGSSIYTTSICCLSPPMCPFPWKCFFLPLLVTAAADDGEQGKELVNM